jgi:hypothetical protein
VLLADVHKAALAKKEGNMAKTEKFEEDLEFLLSKLSPGLKEKEKERLDRLKDRLIELHRINVVKINHSVMELVCAKHLIPKQYDVEVEHQLGGGVLTCDLFATKSYGTLIVEIETGFIPPEHALDPSTYLWARIASKIIRYSNYAGKFALGIPPHYVLQIPETLVAPPRQRTLESLKTIKSLCDQYYQNPPVGLDEVKNARLHDIYIIDVDNAVVQEVDPETYLKAKPISKSE